MKDVAGSGRTPYGLVCGDLAKRHSKMFSITLVLTLIALVAFAAFLVSDIMSFESNASYEKSFSVFSFMNSKENGSNSSREDVGVPLSPLNGSEAAKGSPAGDDNAGKRLDPTASANSSLNNASTLTGQTAGTAAAIIMPSGSGSHRSDKNKKHSSLKNNIQVNRDASPPSTAAENQSQLNQSQNRVNLSSDLSLNLSASEPKMNATEIPSYNSRPEDTDISFGNSSVNSFADSSDNSSANPDALSQLDMNSTTTSNPNAFNANLSPAADLPENLNVSELGSADGETSNLDVDAAGGMEEEVQIEPTVQVLLPVQGLSIENSIPPGDGEDLEHDSSDEGISDGLVDFNSDIDTNDVGVFADPVETDDWASDGADDEALPPDDVSSEPQYPEHSMTADREWPTNSQEEPAQFASSQEDRSVKSDLDFAEPTSKVVPADKSSSKWKGAENKRLSNREKRDKTAKSQKRSTPARPTRTRPVKPARDNSRD